MDDWEPATCCQRQHEHVHQPQYELSASHPRLWCSIRSTKGAKKLSLKRIRRRIREFAAIFFIRNILSWWWLGRKKTQNFDVMWKIELYMEFPSAFLFIFPLSKHRYHISSFQPRAKVQEHWEENCRAAGGVDTRVDWDKTRRYRWISKSERSLIDGSHIASNAKSEWRKFHSQFRFDIFSEFTRAICHRWMFSLALNWWRDLQYIFIHSTLVQFLASLSHFLLPHPSRSCRSSSISQISIIKMRCSSKRSTPTRWWRKIRCFRM